MFEESLTLFSNSDFNQTEKKLSFSAFPIGISNLLHGKIVPSSITHIAEFPIEQAFPLSSKWHHKGLLWNILNFFSSLDRLLISVNFSFIFTAGNNLDGNIEEKTCKILVESGANVIWSLFGNGFIDSDFFDGREYPSAQPPIQDQRKIAENMRRLISAYNDFDDQPEEGTTRIGISYVISKKDLDEDCAKIKRLKQACNENGIFFNCNTNFHSHPNPDIQRRLEEASVKYTDFGLKNTTTVNGYCQMGAGSSATVDHDGTLLRCPYMDRSQGEGNILVHDRPFITDILRKFMTERTLPCVIREHEN